MIKKTAQAKVTVIVPVYMVEKYLHRCIDSILIQSYTNLEIILVENGSPDLCAAICDEYAKKDPRIVVIHKEHGSLATGRNAGLKKATGDYITQIDSDDFVTVDYVETLLNLSINNDAEISISETQYYKNEKDLFIPPIEVKEMVFDSVSAIKLMLYQTYFDASAWGKLYRRDLFEDVEYSLDFITEDLATTYKLMLKANKIAYTNKQTYYYFLRSDSIMGVFNPKKMGIIKLFEIMINDLRKKDESLLTPVYGRMVSGYFNLFFQVRADDPNSDILWAEIKKHRLTVLKDPEGRRKAKLASLISFLGSGMTRRLYKVIDRRK